jgi:hypothetical protein
MERENLFLRQSLTSPAIMIAIQSVNIFADLPITIQEASLRF